MNRNEDKKESLNVISTEPIDSLDEVEESKIETEKSKTNGATTQNNMETTSANEAIDNKGSYEEEAPPVKPQRPVSPITRMKEELKSAFPNIEDNIITAVLIAAQGNMDPAFNALLFLSDPTFEPEIPDPIAVEASKNSVKKVTNNTSTVDDEMLARQLQKQFEEEERRRRRKGNRQSTDKYKRRAQKIQYPEQDSDDEFGQIKETFTQGLEEARTTLNGWVSGIAKKFQDGSEDTTQSKQSPKLFGALGGSSFNNNRRTNNFDEDPEIISSDFHNKISLSDNTEVAPPALPTRKSTQSNTSHNSDFEQERSDSFTMPRKWQPLNSDAPVNSDAFLVTDSEDEESGTVNPNVPKKIATENSVTN